MLDSDDAITSATAETNAFGWGVDTWEILSADYDGDEDIISFKIQYHFTGDQDDDKPWCGDSLDVIVSGILKRTDCWSVDSYEVESVESDF